LSSLAQDWNDATLPNQWLLLILQTNYQLTITDTNLCTAFTKSELDFFFFFFIYNEPHIPFFDDTLIILGEDLKLIERNIEPKPLFYSLDATTGLSCSNCPNLQQKPIVDNKNIH